jgi:protein transport protein SEC13
VWQVCWAHPRFGTILASCSFDHEVIIWKEVSNVWTQWKTFSHSQSVNSICWSTDENELILASGSSDNSIGIYRFKDGQWNKSLKKDAHSVGCNSVSWTSGNNLASGGGDNKVKIWKFQNNELEAVKELDEHTDWVRDVSFAPDIGVGTLTLATGSQDKRVVIWKAPWKVDKNGKELQPFDLQKAQVIDFTASIWRLSWSVTGNILAVSSADNMVTLYKENLEGKWEQVKQ